MSADRSSGLSPAHRDAPTRVLVADLDGTLLRSDMLYETFWASTAADWRTPLRAAAALRGGRAGLKRALTGAPVRIDLLPYNAQVIDRLREWRAAGGRTALVTASDQIVAEAVAAHLGLFDHVHGSDGAHNLKGPAKAAFLVETFGAGGFDYMGDSPADLAVWDRAHTAITVDASAGLRARANALKPAPRSAGDAAGQGDGQPGRVVHLGESGPSRGTYLGALRPRRWLANTLVFLPMLAAGNLSPAMLWAGILAFLAFSLAGSGMSLITDLLRLEAHRARPRQRLHALASGALPLSHGTMMAPGLLMAGAAIGLNLGPQFLAVLAVACLGSGAYRLFLAHRPILGTGMRTGLYALRIVAGALATGIFLPVWLLVASIALLGAVAVAMRRPDAADATARDAGH